MLPGIKPMVVVLVICGLCACLLVGWAVAWYYDEKRKRREAEEAAAWERADRAAREASGGSPTPD